MTMLQLLSELDSECSSKNVIAGKIWL